MFESFLGGDRKTWFLVDGTILYLDLRVLKSVIRRKTNFEGKWDCEHGET